MKRIPNSPPYHLAWIILAAGVTLYFAGCKAKSKTTLPPPPAVEVATVTQADVPVYQEWVGILDGLVNAQIRAQVNGYLLTQNYREGDAVKKGDLLFEIDPRPFKAALGVAKGELAQAEAKLGKTELDVKRYAPLLKDKAISREEYDDAVQAKLEAEAAVVSAQSQVEKAQIDLDFTRIVSPIDGIASISKAQIGDLVGPSTGELAFVSTLDPIKAYFNVTEQDYINFVKKFSDEAVRKERVQQLELHLLLANGTVYPFEGRVYAADLKVGPTTGALRLEALFPNPGNALRPGEFARVRVKLDIRHNALLVPQRAVTELQGAYQVAVVDADNKIHIQQVRVGERSGKSWIIEEGLHAGQRVVVEGVQKIREGAVVVPTNVVRGNIQPTGRDSENQVAHVQILYQPADCGDGDFHHHCHRRPCLDVRPSHRAISQHCSARDIHSGFLCGRGRANSGAIRGHAHRTADERRGQPELHVFDQCQRWLDEHVCEFRSEDRPRH